MKTKVLMLPKWYPSRVDRAEGNFIERHARAIQPYADLAVLYVHSDEGFKGNVYEVHDTIENGYRVLRVYFKRAVGRFSLLTKAINFYRYFIAQFMGYRLLRKAFGKADVVHVHIMTRTCFFALYLKWSEGMPFIISEQWSGFLKERRAFNGIKARIGRWLASHSERITTNSQGLRQGMLDYGFTTAIDVIPNVVDTSLFVPRAQILSEGRKRIMHISRLDSHPKNLPGILRAIKMLRTIRDDFELHLIGTGAEEEDQKRLAQSLGIADIVVFHGHKNHKDVADLLSRSCFLVMFSNYETQCCAILEAFACGLPVITTRSGGMTELLDPSRGILVEVGDEKGLANAMDKMLDTYTEYDPPSIRKFVEDGFTPPFIGHQFSELYKSIDQI